MCTLALYHQIIPGFPIVVAANRDEHYDRPSAAPAFVGDDPLILAGVDLRAGGTWLGVNHYGLLIGILNRRSDTSTANNINVRSRGLLCLDVLRLSSTKQVRIALCNVDPGQYLPFTLVCADRSDAVSCSNVGKKISIKGLAQGLHVFSSSSEVGVQSTKRDRALQLFAELCQKSPDELDPAKHVSGLGVVLSDHTDSNANPRDAICVHGEVSGTVSSSIIFYSDRARQMQSFYCAGPPCQGAFTRFPDLGLK